MFINQKGFTLVEIMIATAMLSVLSLGLMSLTSNMAKNQVTTETKLESIELRRLIMTLLMDKTACENTFNGLPIGANITNIKNGNNTVSYSAGSTYGNNTLQIVSFITVDAGVINSAASVRAIDLIITFKKMKKLSSGTISNATIRLNVKAPAANGIISACFSDVDQTSQTNCNSLGGTWTGTTCTLPSCPPNQVLQKINSDTTATCVAINCPSGSYFRGLDASGVQQCETANVYQ
jgi:prepilin-type N-terminal cleavage/methylation domain-containing protein